MKLIGELKKRVEKLKSKEEIKQAIEEAGFELTDEELVNVDGGFSLIGASSTMRCPNCGVRDNNGVQDKDGEKVCTGCGAKITITRSGASTFR